MQGNSSFLLLFSPARTLLLTLLACTAIYWSGLNGPYLVDDAQQLLPIKLWLEGQATLGNVVMGNTSWATHRALAMGSLAVSAWLGGYQPFAFKLGNLLTHLLCGYILWRFLRLVLARDPQLQQRAAVHATLVVSIWLLHPLFVSTVLYSIQRMAQVATLFCFLGLWLYAYVRTKMLGGTLDRRFAMSLIWLGIPCLTMLGIQGKQNAAVLPLLCLVVELAWFSRPRAWPRWLTLFFVATCALPAAVVLAYPLLRPEALVVGFHNYDFNAFEKVLSQPRVLMDYMRMLLAPYPPSMGLFTDDFAVSRGLLSPPSTLAAIAALLVGSLLALRVRKTLPSVFAGWFLFLAGHAVESSYLPIELYYEHRNYLPGFGLLLAALALVAHLLRRLEQTGVRTSRIAPILIAGIVLVLCVQTLGRVQVWQRALTISYAGIEAHPNSIRANYAFASAALEMGLVADARAVFERMSTEPPDARTRALGYLGKVYLGCVVNGDANPSDLQLAVDTMPSRITLDVPYGFAHVASNQRARGCGRIDARMLADAMSRVADRATAQSPLASSKWALRYSAAMSYADAQDWPKAMRQARLAWQIGGDPAVAQLLVTTLLKNQKLEEAEQVYQQAVERTGALSRTKQDRDSDAIGLRALREGIDQYRRDTSNTRD